MGQSPVPSPQSQFKANTGDWTESWGLKNVAEREGFEPSIRGFAPYTRFPGERLRPTQPSLRIALLKI